MTLVTIISERRSLYCENFPLGHSEIMSKYNE
jgi:hypothetical protein